MHDESGALITPPKKQIDRSPKRIAGFILLLCLSAVFFYSAWTKLVAIEPFAWTFEDILHVNMLTANVLARIFIGLEFLLGLFLLFHVFLSSFTYKTALVFLSLLTLYLLAVIIRNGDSGNCGCFGNALPMRPSTAIFKNIGLIAIVVLLMKIYRSGSYNGVIYVAITIAAASITVPFVLNPMYDYSSGKVMNKQVNLDAVYTTGKPVPTVDLRKGRHVLLFFSLTCPHCKDAATLLGDMYRQYPDLPFYMILSGDTTKLPAFLAATKSDIIPHTLFNNDTAFIRMAGQYVPAIYWSENSVFVRQTFPSEINPAQVKTWAAGKGEK